MKNLLLILSFFAVFFISSCEEESPNTKIPFVYVQEEINPSSIQYKELWNVGGYAILENAGYSGIFIYRANTSEYRAFEMTCTFDPRDPCSELILDDSQLFLKDECCNSTYSLDGIPTGGPANIPLVEYQTRMEGNLLIIFNH